MLIGAAILLFCTLAATLPAAAQDIPLRFRELSDSLSAETGYPRLEGNSIQLQTTGPEFIDALFEDVRRARTSIEMELFIFRNDKVGFLLRDLLVDKAREGVAVQVLVDNILSVISPSAFLEKLERAGGEVRYFVDTGQPLARALKVGFNRDHRKIIVLDGQVAYVGGMNPYDKVIGWEDAHVRMEGPVVASARDMFRQMWEGNGGTALQAMPVPPQVGTVVAQMLPGVPESRESPTSPYQVFLGEVVRRAQSYVYIQTPYIWMPDWLLNLLSEAVGRGVDVRVIAPATSDYTLSTHLNFAAHTKVLSAGVRLFEYADHFSHAKVFVSDDAVACVGSLNLNSRSFVYDYECGVLFYDDASIAACKAPLDRLMETYYEVTEYRPNAFMRSWLSFLSLFHRIL